MSTASRVRPRQRIGSTALAIRGTFRRRDTTAVFTLVAAAYTLAYLWAIGDLVLVATDGIGLDVVAPLGRAFEPGVGAFSFEGVAVADIGVATYVVSPLNTAIAAGLGALVGLNLALSYLAVVRPASCGIGASSGLLASIPALLSGSACCAPVVLIALGITASGGLITAINWLLPVSLVLLLASLAYLAERVDRTALQPA